VVLGRIWLPVNVSLVVVQLSRGRPEASQSSFVTSMGTYPFIIRRGHGLFRSGLVQLWAGSGKDGESGKKGSEGVERKDVQRRRSEMD